MGIRAEVAELMEHTTYITPQTKSRTTKEFSFFLKIGKQTMKKPMK
jgi:hypothetical protein